MGFFSWHTNDTKQSISNNSSARSTFPVTMIDDKGNKYLEESYDGYGVFGGKDFYELLAEMNGIVVNKKKMSPEEYTDKIRVMGIDLAFSDTDGIKWPNLVAHPDSWQYENKEPKTCKYQGFFYPEIDYDEEFE